MVAVAVESVAAQRRRVPRSRSRQAAARWGAQLAQLARRSSRSGRSLSLAARPRPYDRGDSCAWVAASARIGSSSISRGIIGRSPRCPSAQRSHDEVGDRLAADFVARSPAHVGAHRAQDVEEPGARGIDADILQHDLRAEDEARRDDRKAAEDMSPGTRVSTACSSRPGSRA